MSQGLLVVRLRSSVNVRHDMKKTLESLCLTRVNHATIIPDTPSFIGMLNIVKDLVTYGPVTADKAAEVLAARGRLLGDKPITDAHLAKHSSHKTVRDYAMALAAGKAKLGDVEGVKPVLRLSPPRQGHEGIKHSFTTGGALGNRGAAIGDFVSKMV